MTCFTGRPPVMFFHCKASRRKTFQWTEGEYETLIAILVESGRFKYTMRGETKDAGKDDIVFFPANEPFRRTIIEPLEFHHICLDNPAIGSGWDLLCGKYSFEDKARVQSTAKMLTMLAGETEIKTSSEKQKHLVYDLLYQLAIEQQLRTQTATTCEDTLISEICAELRAGISEKVHFNDLAKKYGMTQVQLIRRFTRAVGTTPGKYLTDLRLELGYRLLSGGAVTAIEASELCGYESQFYFSQCFKKKYGITPSDAKKLNKKVR